MINCQDPFVKSLKEKGYNLIGYPKTAIKILDLYKHKIDNKFTRIIFQSDVENVSNLYTIFSDDVSELIGIREGKGSNIEWRKTQKIKMEFAAPIIAEYFPQIAPNVDTAFENTSSVTFHTEEILTIDVDQNGLKNWLLDNQKKLRLHYEDDIRKGNFFVAVSLLKAKKVNMQTERLNKAKVSVDMTKIPNIGLKLDVSNSSNDQLVFNSDSEGAVFGIKLARLMFSSKKNELTIDNRHDFYKVLGKEGIDLDYFSSLNDNTFVEIE
jgi:hypothetical protein